MNWKATLAATALLSAMACASAASATVLFQSNFSADNGGVGQLNYTGFPNFYIANAASGGAVDLIGNGYYDLYPGPGLYVDICGSAGACGDLTTDQTFGPGTYQVSIALGGNARINAPDTTYVNFGSFSGAYTLSENQTQIVNTTVTLTSASQLSVSDAGVFGPDIGNILYSVEISSVPEPATWAMMLAGFGLAGGSIRRNARSVTTAKI